MKWFWEACDKVGAPFGPLLQVLLISGQRLNEVAGMRRDELRLDGTWLIPGARSKNHRENLLTLPPMAHELLDRMQLIEGSPFIFTTNSLRPVSGWSKAKKRLDATMLAIAQKADPNATIEPWRLHDLRHTFVTGMNELGIAPHIVEAVVNHVSGFRAGVAGIYNRAQYVDEKRAALERWAAHLHTITIGNSAKVTSLRRG